MSIRGFSIAYLCLCVFTLLMSCKNDSPSLTDSAATQPSSEEASPKSYSQECESIALQYDAVYEEYEELSEKYTTIKESNKAEATVIEPIIEKLKMGQEEVEAVRTKLRKMSVDVIDAKVAIDEVDNAVGRDAQLLEEYKTTVNALRIRLIEF